MGIQGEKITVWQEETETEEMNVTVDTIIVDEGPNMKVKTKEKEGGKKD